MFVSFTAVILVSLFLGLLGAYWLLTRRSKPKPASPPVPAARAAAEKHKPADSLPPGHPTIDPIHQFVDGEREDVPFSCPFMAAFKEARKKEEEGATHEIEPPADSPVMAHFTEMMAGYEDFRRKKEEQLAAKAEDDDEVSQSSLVGHIKRLEQEKLILQLTEEEMMEEENARRSQLAEIFALMEAQKDKFGINSVNEMQKQMRLYVS